MAYGESHGHVIDDVMWPWDVNMVTQYVWGFSRIPCPYQTVCGNLCTSPILYPFLFFLSFPPPYSFSPPLPIPPPPLTLTSSPTTSLLHCLFPPSMPLHSYFTPSLIPATSLLYYSFRPPFPSPLPLPFSPAPSLLVCALPSPLQFCPSYPSLPFPPSRLL